MELWELQIALGGLIYRDMHTLEALRLQTYVSANTWSSKPMSLQSFGSYPWDTPEGAQEPEETSWDVDALFERSAGALDGIDFS